VQETYVAEQNLEEDHSGTPIAHPLLAEFFDAFENGHYVRRRSLN
jgi:hemimethylated DNA binding protein